MPIPMDFADQQFLEKRRRDEGIQWKWLPLLIAFAAVWFYGAWKLIERIF